MTLLFACPLVYKVQKVENKNWFGKFCVLRWREHRRRPWNLGLQGTPGDTDGGFALTAPELLNAAPAIWGAEGEPSCQCSAAVSAETPFHHRLPALPCKARV